MQSIDHSASTGRRSLSKTLSLYIFRDFLVAITFCLCGFLTLFLIAALLDDLEDLLQDDASVGEVARFFFLLQGEHLVYALPTGLLVATMFSITRLCRHNELTASWASGVSLSQFSAPIWAITLVLTLGHFVLAECVAPSGRRAAETLKATITDPYDVYHPETERRYLAFHNKDMGREWFFEDFTTVGDCRRVTVTQFRPDRTINWELRAERARFERGQWTFFNLTVTRFDEHGLPHRQPSATIVEQTFADLTENPRSFTVMMRLQALEQFSVRSLHALLNDPTRNPSPQTRAVLATYYYHRLFAPLSCIIAVLIAIPLAITRERRTSVRNFVGAVAVMVLYYLVSQCFVVLGKAQIVAPLVVGLVPSAVFIAWGLWGLKRAQ